MITNLTNRFAVTNEAINNMETWHEIFIPASPGVFENDTDDESQVMLNRTSFINRLNEFRNQVTSEENRENNVFHVSSFFSAVNQGMRTVAHGVFVHFHTNFEVC